MQGIDFHCPLAVHVIRMKKKKKEEEEESFIDMASCECKYLLQAGKGHKSQLMDCFENG